MSQIALDTNILVRLAVPEHPFRAEAQAAVEMLHRLGRTTIVFPQMIYEFWAVATRTAAANGMGLSARQAEMSIDGFLEWNPLLLDNDLVFTHWRELAHAYAITGVNSHDMRIVASMKAHGVSTLLTCNRRDFKRYTGVIVMTPEEVLAPDQISNEGDRTS